MSHFTTPSLPVMTAPRSYRISHPLEHVVVPLAKLAAGALLERLALLVLEQQTKQPTK
jgi:hypothetical protein